MNDVNDKWVKLEESQNELLNMVRSFCEMVIQRKQAANISTYTPEPSRRYNYEDDDDDEEYSIPLNKMPQILLSIALVPISSIMEPKDSLIVGDEHLSTIPENECDLPLCDDFSPIPEGKSMTFSNPLFDANDDFTSSDDESLSDEDVLEDNVKIYSNPLFEFDDEYISSDVNPLFDELLEDIESKDSYVPLPLIDDESLSDEDVPEDNDIESKDSFVSKLDEPNLLVTPLSKHNEDECFDPGGDVDEIEFLLHRDPSTPKISVASILEGFTDEPPLEENDDLFDLESKENEWKKILYDAPIDDLMTEDKVFDPGIWEIIFSPTYVKLPFEDRHYLSLTYVIRIFLPYFTYPVESPFLLSSGSEDTIFDPGIPVFSLEPVVGRSTRVVSSDEASLGDQEDASKQERKIHDIDADEDITLENVHDHDIMFDVSDLAGEEVFVAEQGVPDNKKDDPAQVNTTIVSTAITILVSAATITEDEITLPQALAELKSAKPKTAASTRPKAKGLVIHEEEQATTPTMSSQQPSQVKVQDKGKGILVEEPVKSIKKKDQIRLDEELAFKLQAEKEEEERLAREKVEANVALIDEWNDIQAKIEGDQLIDERLQAREQEELTIKERAKLFQQLLEKRRKFFAAKRAEEKRNKPPTRAQQRSIMCTYLKNMVGWKPKDLKSKSFTNIQELFDKAFKRVNTFVDFRTELVEGSEVRTEGSETREESSSKRAGDELEQENAKKQKVDDDQEATKMKELMKIVPNEEEVAVDAMPLATKPPSIID
ncbi:hypothetical protein Tco_1255029 [Tanacetum coccineum]